MIYNWACIILSFLVIGEAIALLIGMRLSDSEDKEWLSNKNYLILILDIITGLIVIVIILINSNKNFSLTLIFILILISLSHIYREIEYFTQITNKFCANFPLFVFNNVKLCISIICIGIGIFLQTYII